MPTRLPVRRSEGLALDQPSFAARSEMARSSALIATGAPFTPATHAVSQGAGHTRLVTSGKLFVASSATMASRHRSVRTSSFQSGIAFPRGHPV